MAAFISFKHRQKVDVNGMLILGENVVDTGGTFLAQTLKICENFLG